MTILRYFFFKMLFEKIAFQLIFINQRYLSKKCADISTVHISFNYFLLINQLTKKDRSVSEKILSKPKTPHNWIVGEHKMNQIQRSLLAFLVAPVVPILMLSFYVLGIENFFQAMPVVGAFAYLITLFVAVPIYIVMLFKKWSKWWHFALLGVIPALSLDIWSFVTNMGLGGGLVSLRQDGIDIIVEGKRTFAGYVYLVKRIGFYSLTGVGAGLLFWYVAHGKNTQKLALDLKLKE